MTISTSASAPRSEPSSSRPSNASRSSGAQLAAGDRAGGRSLEPRPAGCDAGLGDLDADHLHAVPGQHLGDPGAHRAEPDHADPGERRVPCRPAPARDVGRRAATAMDVATPGGRDPSGGRGRQDTRTATRAPSAARPAGRGRVTVGVSAASVSEAATLEQHRRTPPTGRPPGRCRPAGPPRNPPAAGDAAARPGWAAAGGGTRPEPSDERPTVHRADGQPRSRPAPARRLGGQPVSPPRRRDRRLARHGRQQRAVGRVHHRLRDLRPAPRRRRRRWSTAASWRRSGCCAASRSGMPSAAPSASASRR